MLSTLLDSIFFTSKQNFPNLSSRAITSSGCEARYFVTDHLGSTRLVTNSSGTVLEQNDYMPYGERHTNSALAASTNPYLYNGKESQKDFGINYIDSEARFQH